MPLVQVCYTEKRWPTFSQSQFRYTINPSTPEECGYLGGIPIPQLYMEDGAGVDADFVLFATARPTLGSVIAYAGSCKFDQYGRPLAGHVNFGPNRVSTAVDDRPLQVGVR